MVDGTYSFTLEQVLALAVLFITWLGVLGGVVKWLLGRIDVGDRANAHTARRAHERLDALPNVFVRREEVIGHFERLENQLGESRRETNQRFDRLYEILLDHTKKGDN